MPIQILNGTLYPFKIAIIFSAAICTRNLPNHYACALFHDRIFAGTHSQFHGPGNSTATGSRCHTITECTEVGNPIALMKKQYANKLTAHYLGNDLPESGSRSVLEKCQNWMVWGRSSYHDCQDSN